LAATLPAGSTANSIWGTSRNTTIPLTITSQPRIYGGQTTDVGTYESIVGVPPEEGTVVFRLNRWANLQYSGGARFPTSGGFFLPPAYLRYEFSQGNWIPAEPIINLGEAVWIFRKPRLSNPKLIDGSWLRFSVPTALGQTNYLQFAEGSPDASWQTYTNLVGDGNLMSFTVPALSALGQSRFYRIAISMPNY
jgi:hypothetical protein